MNAQLRAIGIDIGGTKMAVAAVDGKGQIAARLALPTEAELGFDRAVGRLGTAILEVLSVCGWPVDDISGIGIGWAKPVPFNPNNLRGSYRQGIGLVSVAGPAANLILAVVAAILARLGMLVRLPGVVNLFFVYVVVVNVSLMLFNLIPLPPLDGAKVFFGILGSFRGQWAYTLGNRLMDLERYGFMPLFALLIVNSFVPILSLPLGVISNLIISLLL